MVDIARLALEVDTSSATAAVSSLDRLSASAGRAEGSATDLAAATRLSSSESQRAASLNSALSNELRNGYSESNRAATSYRNLGTRSAELARGSGITANSLRNTSLQLSQVAQQGSVTGNFLQALAIQLPDLAIGFGAAGIAAGALLGVLASYLVNSNDAGRATRELEASLTELSTSFTIAENGAVTLSDELIRLARASLDIAELSIDIRTDQALAAVTGFRQQIAETVSEALEVGSFVFGLDSIIESGNVASQTLNRLALNSGLTRQEVLDLSEAFDESAGSTDPFAYEALSQVVSQLRSTYGTTNESVNILSQSISTQIESAIRAAEAFTALNSATIDGQTSNEGLIQSLIEKNEELVLTEQQQLINIELSKLTVDATEEERESVSDLVLEYLRLRDAKNGQETADRQATRELERSQREQERDRVRREREEARAQERFAALVARNVSITLTEREREAVAFRNNIDQFKTLRDDDLISEQQYQAGIISARQASAERTRLINQNEQDQRAQQNQVTLQASSEFFGNLASIAEAGGRRQFETYKDLASAQAAISATLAVINTLASVPYPFNIVAAASIGVLAAVQVSQIQSQQYSGSRQLGGQAQAGRSLLVGESGPEVLTMGAQSGFITPNSALGGNQSSTTVNVIEDASRAGTQESQQLDEQEIINIFVANISRGGQASRAIQSSFGITRAGR